MKIPNRITHEKLDIAKDAVRKYNRQVLKQGILNLNRYDRIRSENIKARMPENVNGVIGSFLTGEKGRMEKQAYAISKKLDPPNNRHKWRKSARKSRKSARKSARKTRKN